MRYKALSSVARTLLPRAERMHQEGMTWKQITRDLKISKSALHIWRKLGENGRNPYQRTGVMIWILMVKRKLYQEVSTTKLTRTPTQSHTTGSRDEGR